VSCGLKIRDHASIGCGGFAIYKTKSKPEKTDLQIEANFAESFVVDRDFNRAAAISKATSSSLRRRFERVQHRRF
jgi:hypothetical protein